MDNRKTSVFTFLLVVYGFAAFRAFGATTYQIPAPGGVGDVGALTNAIMQLNLNNNTGAKILLDPGVYDLRGVFTPINGKRSGAHLYFNSTCKNGLIAGLGATPGDTVLLGGGEADNMRVLHIWSTSATTPTVVSNLTVTCGYQTGDAGGIYGSTSGGLILRDLIITNNYSGGLGGGVLRAKMYNCLIADNRSSSKNGGGFWSDTAGLGAQDCIFSNNTTTATGGGLYSSGANGFLINCKFYDNSAGSASGAYFGGANSVVSNCLFQGNAPTAAASSNKLGGGLYLASGDCIDCVFTNNAADRGGGMYIASNSSSIRNCLFVGNRQTGWASGAAIFVNASSPLALVSNCVFNANMPNWYSSRTVISNADLVDCVITNHDVLSGYVIAGCNMTRCLFAHNSTTVNAQHLDIGTIYGGTTVYRTNVNCIVAYNHAIDSSSITDGKKVVNCTYYSNICDKASYPPLHDSTAWNTILADNVVAGRLLDVRGASHPHLTNCVFTVSDVAVNADGLSGCKQNSNIKFEPSATGGEFDIRHSSPARDLGVIEDWMVPLLGATDYAGRPRVMFGAIDAGALECQRPPRFFLMQVQ